MGRASSSGWRGRDGEAPGAPDDLPRRVPRPDRRAVLARGPAAGLVEHARFRRVAPQHLRRDHSPIQAQLDAAQVCGRLDADGDVGVRVRRRERLARSRIERRDNGG